jgi:hypothetical protein
LSFSSSSNHFLFNLPLHSSASLQLRSLSSTHTIHFSLLLAVPKLCVDLSARKSLLGPKNLTWLRVIPQKLSSHFLKNVLESLESTKNIDLLGSRMRFKVPNSKCAISVISEVAFGPLNP